MDFPAGFFAALWWDKKFRAADFDSAALENGFSRDFKWAGRSEISGAERILDDFFIALCLENPSRLRFNEVYEEIVRGATEDCDWPNGVF